MIEQMGSLLLLFFVCSSGLLGLDDEEVDDAEDNGKEDQGDEDTDGDEEGLLGFPKESNLGGE